MATAADVRQYFNAGYPGIVLNSFEEKRALRDLVSMARRHDVKLWKCTVTDGMVRLDQNGGSGSGSGSGEASPRIEKIDTKDPNGVLDTILKREGDNEEWFVLCDFDSFLQNPIVQRKAKDLLQVLHGRAKKVIYLQAGFNLPQSLMREITVLDFGLPNRGMLREEAEGVFESCRESVIGHPNESEFTFPKTDEQREAIIESVVGMTALEASNALSRVFLVHKCFDVDALTAEKMAVVKKTGMMELYPTNYDMSVVGGHGVLKRWLAMRRRSFTQEARDYGLKMPKGIVMLGPPGTGKSLVAKCVAKEWLMALLRLDAGRLFEGTVGSSERNVRMVIEMSDQIGRCALWMDEIDKGMAMPKGATVGGGEVTKHVVGSLITWMQEKTSPVFIVATCNDWRSVPPELLRKGRFDELFFVDLPGQRDRVDIAGILLGKVKRKPAAFDLETIAAESGGYTGAEMEQAIDEGMCSAFYDESREVVTDDIVAAIRATTPISKTMETEIGDLREWANGRARFSSMPEGEDGGDGGVGSGRRIVTSV